MERVARVGRVGQVGRVWSDRAKEQKSEWSGGASGRRRERAKEKGVSEHVFETPKALEGLSKAQARFNAVITQHRRDGRTAFRVDAGSHVLWCGVWGLGGARGAYATVSMQ